MPAPRPPDISAIDVAHRHYGSLTELARVVGKSPQAMSQRVRRQQDLTLEECWLVHRDSRIPLRTLRPDFVEMTEGEE